MDFGLSEEQQLIVGTTRAFVENELYPHEQEVERTGHLRPDLVEIVQLLRAVPEVEDLSLSPNGVRFCQPSSSS